MRRTLVLFLLVIAPGARAQVWEKYLAPGLTYRMELEPDLPLTIHALHFNMHSDSVHAMPELGQLKVYNDDKTKGRATVSDLVRKTGALAGINANFFPYTGRPIGLMVRNKELISSPMASRPEFAWGPGCRAGFALSSSFSATFRTADSEPVELDGLNDEAKPNWVCLDTETGGYALTKTGTGTCALIRADGGSLRPNGHLSGVVQEIVPQTAKLPIPAGDFALMGTGVKEHLVSDLKPGDRVAISTRTNGFDWSKVSECVCGGPVLLKDGKTVLDWADEGFNKDFSLKRHPRSAVGRDAHGDIWLVAVDGRQSESEGATLPELADVMARLGCKDAINLDGGGSTTLDILGVTVNRPSDGVEREVANAILFFGPKPPVESVQLSLKAPGTASIGDKVQLRVLKPDGEEVPGSEVLWSASGAGWIDQGGLLRVDRAGLISVSAYVHGQVLTGQIKSAQG